MNSYQQYPNSNIIHDHAKLLSMSLEDVKKLYANWLEIRTINDEIYKANNKECSAAYEEIIKLFKFYRIEYHTKNGNIAAWFENNIYSKLRQHFKVTTFSKPSFPAVSGENDLVKAYTKLKAEADQQSANQEKSNKLLRKSIEYAIKQSINVDGLSDKELINLVNEHASENWMHENYPEDTEIGFSYAICECETGFIGQRRCSCGNRRISAYPEGNILDGFYLEIEPC